jgi:hypothetical protein
MLFGKKKEQKQVAEEQTHPAVDDLMKKITALENIPSGAQPIPTTQARTVPEEVPTKVSLPTPKEPEMEEERPSFAPLFVKIDRYRQILSTMNYLKNTMMLIKNNFAILSELEKLKEENLKLIENTLDRMEKKILSLDSQFMRPSGFMEDEEVKDAGALDATIADLSGQIEDLKAQLENINV